MVSIRELNIANNKIEWLPSKQVLSFRELFNQILG